VAPKQGHRSPTQANPIICKTKSSRNHAVRPDGAYHQWRKVPTTAKLMVFKLVTAAAKTWRRLKGENQFPKVV